MLRCQGVVSLWRHKLLSLACGNESCATRRTLTPLGQGFFKRYFRGINSRTALDIAVMLVVRVGSGSG